ncbi:MAG: hypothetical protein WBX15_16485, partial [Thermoanaerobaculia bacterium]
TGEALRIDPANVEGRTLHAHLRAINGDCSGALDEIAALDSKTRQTFPELFADRFVCLVALERWSDAKGAFLLVPSEFLPRPDVATAHEALRDQVAKGSSNAQAPTAASPETPPPTATPTRPLPPRTAEAAPAPAPRQENVAAESAPEDRFTAAIAETRKLIESGQAAEAEEILFRAVRAAPERRDVRLAFLEAAVLANDFATARAQVPLLEPFGKSESVSKFYAAVALWQSGEPDAARRYAKEARPHIRVNAWVAAWLEKMLGGE